MLRQFFQEQNRGTMYLGYMQRKYSPFNPMSEGYLCLSILLRIELQIHKAFLIISHEASSILPECSHVPLKFTETQEIKKVVTMKKDIVLASSSHPQMRDDKTIWKIVCHQSMSPA